MANSAMHSREDVLSWLKKATDEDVYWIFSKLVSKHHHLLDLTLHEHHHAMMAGKQHTTLLQLKSESKTGDEMAVIESEKVWEFAERAGRYQRKKSSVLLREAEDYQLAKLDVPIVQFSAPMYFCSLEEDEKGNLKEEFIILDVIRIGNLDSKSEISFETQDVTAKAGVKFVGNSGRITFSEGSNSEQIRIDLLRHPVFDTTTEFKVKLMLNPPSVNCQVGRYLYVTRVKVIDGDSFPSNKFAEQLRNDQVDDISFWPLAWEYVKFNVQSPVTRRGTIKWILVDSARAMKMLLQWLVSLYLVDLILLGGGSQQETMVDLFFTAFFMIAPLLIEHLLDFRRTTWKVGGSSRAKLQSFLLRKFLNYEYAERINLNSARLGVAMTRDVNHVVHEGYIKFLRLLGSAQNLVAVFLFELIVPFSGAFSVQFRPPGIAAIFFLASSFVIFFALRLPFTSRHITAQNHLEEELTAQSERTVFNYRLIADYAQRSRFEEEFDQKVAAFNRAKIAAGQVRTNNLYFAPWVTNLLLAAYVIYGGLRVFDKILTPGYFLATLQVLKSVGKSYSNAYRLLLDIETMAPALRKVVRLINLPIDVPHRKELNHEQRSRSAALRSEVSKTLVNAWPVDHLPIEMNDLEFAYVSDPKKPPVFAMQGSVRFNQGELTALVGPAGEGKSTLLYMLGGVVLPKPGHLFVPSHLRVIHVSAAVYFFKASLYDNLTFACHESNGVQDHDGAMSRVLTICERLRLPEEIIHMIQQGHTGPVMQWGEILAQSHRSALMFARAVITNPELMFIHKPFNGYTMAEADLVLKMLREFCELKGVEQVGDCRHLRRPRTCVISANTTNSVKECDQIYFVSRRSGVQYVPKELITPDDITEDSDQLCQPEENITAEFEESSLSNKENITARCGQPFSCAKGSLLSL